MVARILLGIGVLLTGLFGALSTFVDHSVDWALRLKSPNSYSIVATSTVPIPLESPKPLITKEEPKNISTTTPVVPKKAVPPPAPAPAPAKKTVPPALVLAPPHIATSVPSTIGAINEKAVLDLTNVERVKQGAGALSWNEKLAVMAYKKAKDMLDQQYFAHESPGGKSVGGLAEDAGYAYRLVGENLAVGNFRTNEELILAWMESPGHRENILKGEYTEMGVAAIEGTFEGSHVWMAVQEFGKPFPVCDKPSEEMKEELAALNAKLTALDEGIQLTREAIESSQDGEVRDQKIAEYNALVDTYNGLVTTHKTLVPAYNAAVRAYNTCVNAP